MKNILCLIHDDSGQEARFQAALDAGRAVQGHLTCLDVAIISPMVGIDDAGIAIGGTLLADELAREDVQRLRLEARLRVEDVPWTYLTAAGGVAESLREHAELADLIVVNRQLSGYPLPDMRTVATDLIVSTGKPVLAVGEDLKRLDLGAAMVAWNGSHSCIAALRAAVPLLQLADRVTIVEIADGAIETPAEEGATYLSRHGIEARIKRLPGDIGVALKLAEYGLDGDFGYIVLGGFGRRPLAEALFGGTSRALLTASPLPLFMMH